jgi:hypothetical protein
VKHEEYLDLKDLIEKRGWAVFQKLLQEEFDKAYKKLRTVSCETLKSEQRYLDGIEKAMKLAQVEVDNYVKDDNGQAEQGPV